jgi:hypothetical protein
MGIASLNYMVLRVKNIGIRKVKTGGAEYYESVADSIPFTCKDRLRGVTEAGKRVLLQRVPVSFWFLRRGLWHVRGQN